MKLSAQVQRSVREIGRERPEDLRALAGLGTAHNNSERLASDTIVLIMLVWDQYNQWKL